MENASRLALARAADRGPLVPVFCGDRVVLARCFAACSARAGGYEDPDRTVWTPDEEEEDFAAEKSQERTQGKVDDDVSVEGMSADDASDDEFPAQEQ